MHRKVQKWSLPAFLLLLVALAGRPDSTEAQSPAGQVIGLVNGLRAEYGLAPYTENPALSAAAQRHASWMASTGVYSHTGGDGSTPQSRATDAGYVGYVTENIVGGTNLSPQQGVTWWINSPVHFNTLIARHHNEVGVGHAVANGQNFYVLVAGHKDGSAAPLPQAAGAGDTELLYVAPLTLSPPREDGSIVHTVQAGQSLWVISARYEAPLRDLLLFNNLTEDSVINPGDELLVRLPEGAEPPPTPTPPTTHVVRAGESAWTIAARFRISLENFLWFNSMSEYDVLFPGETVIIRLEEGQTPPPTPTPKLTHQVQSGQTLWEIALLHGLTLEELLSLNSLAEDAMLSVGQELYIRPTDAPATTPTPWPPTFTPAAAAAQGEEAGQDGASTATPESIAMASVGGATRLPVSNAVVRESGSDWTVYSGLAVFGVALALLGLLVAAAVRRYQPEI